MKSLVGVPNDAAGATVPRHVPGNVFSDVFEAVDCFYSSSSDEKGDGVLLLFLKSKTNFLIFPTLMQRLCFPHPSIISFTSCRYHSFLH